MQIPLVDYSSYTMADDDQKAAIQQIAEECKNTLSEQANTEEMTGSALYEAASPYVPQAMEALGATMEDATQAMYYAGAQLYTPDDLSSYGSDDYNNLTDPLDEAGMNQWTVVDLGTTLLVARRIDPLKSYTVEDLTGMYDLLTAMKSDDLQNQFYADGAALAHNLDEGAMKTYSASKIKKNV